MGRGQWLLSIKDSRFRAAVYIPALAFLGITLLFALPAGLGPLVFAFFLFALPYWFGERRPGKLLLRSLLALLITAIALAVVLTSLSLSNGPRLQESEDGLLIGGTVTPFSGAPDSTPFTFSVTYNTSGVPLKGPTVNITSSGFGGATVTELNMTPDTTGGSSGVYSVTTTLPDGRHTFHFSIKKSDGRWVETGIFSGGGRFDSEGPLTLSSTLYFLYFLTLSMEILFFFTLAPLLLLVTLYWWFKKSGARRRAFLAGPTHRECPHCGAAITEANALMCPVCGKSLAETEGGSEN